MVTARIIRANALDIPLADGSVDLVVTSPPYYGLRRYEDNGDELAGQLGCEPHPQEYLENLWSVMAELWRVLAPTGSAHWNIGDKRAGSGSNNNSGVAKTNRTAPAAYTKAAFGRPKTKMLLPHRFAIGCIDGRADPEGIGWLVRQDQVWFKRNAIPDSTRDRTADRHEYWFHMTKQGDYYEATDELRSAFADGTADRSTYDTERQASNVELGGDWSMNPAGKRPGSVWDNLEDSPEAALWAWMAENMPTQLDAFLLEAAAQVARPDSVWKTSNEPFHPPDHLTQHFAAYPTEWPRRIITGWSPPGYCLECGEARRCAVNEERTLDGEPVAGSWQATKGGHQISGQGIGHRRYETKREVLGYECACGLNPPAPTRPAVVLDPFVGTGTTLIAAEALGRTGIGLDLSGDYIDLARWRINESGAVARVKDRTWGDRQGSMF